MTAIPKSVIDGAQLAQRKWGIPASVSIAQFALESAWGTRMPKGSNNPFGIKARDGQPYSLARTREVIHGKEVYIQAKFRKFATFTEAFDEHGRLVGSRPQYARAMKIWADTHNVELFVKALAPVYATDPKYAQLIMSIIKGRNLTQYDEVK